MSNQSPEGLADRAEDAVQMLAGTATGLSLEGWNTISNALLDAAKMLRDHTGEGDALLRRCLPYINAAHAGIDTPAERIALRCDLDAHLSRTPDRGPLDRKAVLEEAARVAEAFEHPVKSNRDRGPSGRFRRGLKTQLVPTGVDIAAAIRALADGKQP